MSNEKEEAPTTIAEEKDNYDKKLGKISRLGSSFGGTCKDGNTIKSTYFHYNGRLISTELVKGKIKYDPDYPFSKNFGLLRIYNGLFNKKDA